jgi:hypothetical protein
MTAVEWLLIMIPVALTIGFAGGRRWTWRNARGEHAFYGDELSAKRVGRNDPQLTVAECQQRAHRKRQSLGHGAHRPIAGGLRTPTPPPRLTAAR